jgi:L-ribulose-5-phosphate 4-epimerase
MGTYKDLKEITWECNQRLPRSGLVLENFGNVSAIDREKGVFAIKPSGVPYGTLKVDDIVIVDLENKVVEGRLRPSSDTKTHAVLYKNLSDIGGIVHTHSTYAVAWAQALRPIPILGTTHADHLPTEIPVTEVMSDEMIEGDYEEETGNLIIQTLKNPIYKDAQMILVACHGPFTWASNPQQAVYNSIILEEIAKMAFLTLRINPGVSTLKQSLIDKHHRRKHGKDAYYGQP